MTAWAKIGLILLWTTTVFTAGWTVESWRIGAAQTAQVETNLTDREAAEKTANQVAAKTETIKSTDSKKADQIIHKETADVAKKQPAYTCVVPAAGMQSLRDLVAARSGSR